MEDMGFSKVENRGTWHAMAMAHYGEESAFVLRCNMKGHPMS
jgi:hypothetical protein